MLRLAMNNWVAKIAATLLNFGTVIALSRNLGAEGRGICAFYVVIFAFILVINELAAGSTIVYLQKNYSWKQMRLVAAMWSFAASGIVTTGFFFFGYFGYTEWALIWIICVVNALVTIQYNILLGKQKYVVFNLLAVLTPATVLVLFALSALLKQGSPLRYLQVILIANLISFFIGYFYLLTKGEDGAPGKPIREVITVAFSSGLINQAGHMLSILNSRYIYLIFAATALGVYTNAQSLAESMLLIPGSLGQIYYSQHADHPAGSHQKANRSFLFFLKVNTGIMLLGLLAILLIPAQFYQWIFGPGFIGVKSFLLLTGVISAAYSVFLIISYWQSAQGLFINNLKASVTGIFVNIAGIAILWTTGNLTIFNTLWVMLAATITVSVFALNQFRIQRNRLMTID